MKILQSVVFALFALDYAWCILSSPGDSRDITVDPNFNCRWYGGSSAKLECNCLSGTEEFVIREKSIPPYDVYSINITNCGKIVMAKNAIGNMRNLRAFALENVRSIELQENSLYWIGFTRNTENLIDWDPTIPSIKIKIANSQIDDIANNAIKGRIQFLQLIDSHVNHIAPFGVSNLQQNVEIFIDGTTFHNIEPQSFKKFTTSKLVIKNSVFDTIPSRAFYDITVNNEFLLDNITVLDTLKPGGFSVNDPYKFTMTNSRINNLSGDGFKVSTRDDVLIKDNIFNHTGIGAFRAITLNREDADAYGTIRFERNVFNTLSKDALVVDKESFKGEFLNLQISELCECGNLERYFRSGENTLELSCLDELNAWVTVDHFQANECTIIDTKSGAAYIIAGVCAIVILLVVSGVVFYFWRMNQRKTYGNNASDKNGKLSMIVPDGRTYRETELHVIVERTDLLTTDL